MASHNPQASTVEPRHVEKSREATTDNPHNPEAQREISKNQAFDILRNSRRRAAISCLQQQGGEMSVNELATCVAAKEYDIAPEAVSSEQYKRVYTGLYQCHLDRAEKLGVVEFNSEDNVVRLRSQASQLNPFLDDQATPGSKRIEVGTAIGVALVVALGGIAATQLSVVSVGLLAVIPIVALLGLAVMQLK